MGILHPIFIIVFLVMIYIFFKEEDMNHKDIKTIFAILVFALIVMAGGRNFVGADFPVYKELYESAFPKYTTYLDVWNKATFRENSMEIEWAYVLINKLLYEMGMPFYVVTYTMAIIALSIYYFILTKYSAFVSFSFLYYLLPLYFIVECGQMRQGLGAAFVVLSIKYIMDRKLLKFLLVMFLALGFHKSTVVFVPAYWLIKLPFNAKTWFALVILSVLSAPFEIYRLFGGAIESFTPADVANAYTGYNNDKYYGNDMGTGFADFVIFFFIVIMLIYDKVGEKKVLYYEYFRNLAFFGFCLFYILRGNEIFATRLPGSYFTLAGLFVVPGILYALEGSARNNLKIVFLSYFMLFFVAFSANNAKKGRFTWDTYSNVLWSD